MALPEEVHGGGHSASRLMYEEKDTTLLYDVIQLDRTILVPQVPLVAWRRAKLTVWRPPASPVCAPIVRVDRIRAATENRQSHD
ncbi:MAG: hypothetical protein ACLGI6_07680 [Gammaproteobacteria bacterium]